MEAPPEISLPGQIRLGWRYRNDAGLKNLDECQIGLFRAA